MNGSISYFGFEYQFHVTVLLMLASHRSPDLGFQNIEVETAFGEDAEARFALSDPNSERTFNINQSIAAKNILIQVKTKQQNYQWQPADIRDLFLKIDESNRNGQTILDIMICDPSSRFLFITDGNLNPSLAGLLISDPLNFSRKYPDESIQEVKKKIILGCDEGKKAILATNLSEDVLNRFYIFQALSLDDVLRRIREILQWDYHIASDPEKIKATVEEMVKMVRNCAFRLNGKNMIVPEDIAQIAGKPGPRLYRNDIEDIFQEPNEWKKALRILDEQSCLILIGEPGVGKTTLAQKLLNTFSLHNYGISELAGPDVHMEIRRLCKSPESIVLFLDDPFGKDVYRSDLGESLADQFADLCSEVMATKGRIKLIITSRRDIFEGVAQQKRFPNLVRKLVTSIESTENDFAQLIATSQLRRFINDSDQISSILSMLTEEFENLVHVRNFCDALSDYANCIDREIVISSFQAARPQSMAKWVERQSESIQLLLLVIWFLNETYIATDELDVKRVFEKLTECFPLPKEFGLSTPYATAIRDLERRGRILRFQENRPAFFHPSLELATQTYFESTQPEFLTFIQSCLRVLMNADHPVEQSIAVSLIVKYYDKLVDPAEKLANLGESKYVIVRDAIVNKAPHLLHHKDNATVDMARHLFEREIDPSEAEINEYGFLVIKKEYLSGIGAIPFSEVFERYIWKEGWKNTQEELDIYKKCLIEKDVHVLNPLAKYRFLAWLFREASKYDFEIIFNFVDKLSTDPISFVRMRVANILGIPGFFNQDKVMSLVKRLCLDSSPYVKIAVLEECIIRNWANQENAIQQELLSLIVKMLEDPIFHFHAAKGLVDQSGTLYFYHQNHTDDQKRLWFRAIAVKLLETRFEADYLDRYLTTFDHYFPDYEKEFRLDLLAGLNSYVHQHRFQATEVVFTISEIVTAHDPSSEETEILLDLINKMPTMAKTSLCYRFAREYDKLPDVRYKEFVDRVFYVEKPEEFIFERCAVILGISDNLILDSTRLSNIFPGFEQDKLLAIIEYINRQSDEFKAVLLLETVKYGRFSSILPYAKQPGDPILDFLLKYFTEVNPTSSYTTFIADAIIWRGYTLWDLIAWETLVNKLLAQSQSVVVQALTKSLFAHNIYYNVQNLKDWLLLLDRLLKNSNQEVSSYAIKLLDEYFDIVWQQVTKALTYPDHENEFFTDIRNVWGTEQQFEFLYEKSQKARAFFTIQHLIFHLIHTWNTLSEAERDNAIQLLILSVCPEDYTINLAIARFIHQMQSQLTDEQKDNLSAIISTERTKRYGDPLGWEEKIAKSKESKKLSPIFDWDKYTENGL